MDVLAIQKAVLEKYGKNNKRYIHIIGVMNLAVKLAIRFGVDVDKAKVAALLHDYYKYESDKELASIIDDKAIVEKYKNNKNLYHAYASGVAVKKIFKIDDDDIYNAVIHHVYGGYHMSRLEEIILISDYCEENRSYSSCIEVRKILEKSLNKAIYACLNYTIQFVTQNGFQVLPEQYEIMNQYKNKE